MAVRLLRTLADFWLMGYRFRAKHQGNYRKAWETKFYSIRTKIAKVQKIFSIAWETKSQSLEKNILKNDFVFFRGLCGAFLFFRRLARNDDFLWAPGNFDWDHGLVFIKVRLQLQNTKNWSAPSFFLEKVGFGGREV